MTLSSSPAKTLLSAPRARNRSWHGESVGGSSLRARSSALGKLSGEIDFAFRAPDTVPSKHGSNASGDDTPRETCEPLQSGDYVAAFQLGKRVRPTATLMSMSRRGSARRVQDDKDSHNEDRLVWDTNDLRQELQRLRDHKRAMETRILYRSIATKDAVYKVTTQYFKMFQSGYENGPLASRHEAFLRSAVDRDVVTCSQLHGVDALVEQWRRYADFFELRDYKLRSVHATAMDDTPILHIECGYHVFITRRTLEQLFPHVLGDPYLVQRVVGKKLECDSRVTFVFDSRCKIFRYDDDSDFVAAFARLLRNPRDLAALMHGALITEDSLIGDLEREGLNEPSGSPSRGAVPVT